MIYQVLAGPQLGSSILIYVQERGHPHFVPQAGMQITMETTEDTWET